jgi:hypothetical protein
MLFYVKKFRRPLRSAAPPIMPTSKSQSETRERALVS